MLLEVGPKTVKFNGVRLKCGSGCGTDGVKMRNGYGVKMRNGTDGVKMRNGTDMGLKRGTERIWG